MRTFVLFLIFAAICAVAVVIGLDVAVTAADHRHHHSYATPPRAAQHNATRRPARTANADTASTETDSTGNGTRSLSLNDTYHAPSGCADRPTATHDDVWDNW